MENQEHSPRRSSKSEWISSFVHLILSYYSELISNPFRTGLVHFAVAFVGVLFVGWIIFPMVLYSSNTQPVELGIDASTKLETCLYCHEFREDGSFAGIPKLTKCMECHDDPESPMTETKSEEILLKDYVAEGKEIPWLSYSRQPD